MSHKIIPVSVFDYFVFGATGDLAKKKLLPALYHRFADGQIPSDSRIIGCSRTELDNEGFRAFVVDSIKTYVPDIQRSDTKLSEFLQILFYQTIDVNADKDWQSMIGEYASTDTDRIRIFYLSVAPSLFAPIINGLKNHGLNNNSRLVLEKPLGEDLASAEELNQLLSTAFDEDSIYRIDHYLGKEAVQNLMALRFANALFEPLWNSQYIDHVQITAAEVVGLQGRGGYYDTAGAMRDMVQNHLLQLLCLSAMEPPARFDADSIRDEKLKVLRSLQPLSGDEAIKNSVRGQYLAGEGIDSYLSDVGKAVSHTESYVAICATINNWRWSGTPFYLRTGKRLRAQMMEIKFSFRQVPHSIFGDLSTPMQPNALVIRLQPNEGIDIQIMTKEPGQGGMRLRSSMLDTAENYYVSTGHKPDAYQRLLLDVVRGDQTLFMRSDEVEAAWAWVDPIVEAWNQSGLIPETYLPSSDGPVGAEELMKRDGRAWNKIQ